VNEAIGGDKISLNDLAEWGRLFFCPNNPYFPRADYFADGIINLNDLANWGNVFIVTGLYLDVCTGGKSNTGPKCP